MYFQLTSCESVTTARCYAWEKTSECKPTDYQDVNGRYQSPLFWLQALATALVRAKNLNVHSPFSETKRNVSSAMNRFNAHPTPNSASGTQDDVLCVPSSAKRFFAFSTACENFKMYTHSTSQHSQCRKYRPSLP